MNCTIYILMFLKILIFISLSSPNGKYDHRLWWSHETMARAVCRAMLFLLHDEYQPCLFYAKTYYSDALIGQWLIQAMSRLRAECNAYIIFLNFIELAYFIIANHEHSLTFGWTNDTCKWKHVSFLFSCMYHNKQASHEFAQNNW